MEVRAEEAAEIAADAKTTEFVLNMLREHEPYEKISRIASTSLENVKKIAHMNNIAYNWISPKLTALQNILFPFNYNGKQDVLIYICL